MTSLIEFHKSKCLNYILLSAFLPFIYYRFIYQKYSKYFINNVFTSFFSYLLQMLSIFVYFYQKKIIKQDLELSNLLSNDNSPQNQYSNIFFISQLFFCSLTNILGEKISFYKDYTYEMKRMNLFFISNFEVIIIFLSNCINEKYFLNIKNHIHHKIAIQFNIFIILIIMIQTIYNFNFNNMKITSLIFMLLLSLESIYLKSLSLIIVKMLNFKYYININLILFFRSLFGFLMIVIFDLFYYFIFHYNFIKLESIDPFKFLILFVFYFLSFIKNLVDFKIIEETRPNFIIIAQCLYNIINNFVFEFSLYNVFRNFLYLLTLFGINVYLEIITLNFYDLDKYTNYKIAERGDNDLIVIQNVKELNLSCSYNDIEPYINF